MEYAPSARWGFFPLDEELGLGPGQLSPQLQNALSRLSSWMPFAQASRLLSDFWQVSVSRAATRRQAEAVGQTYVAVQSQQVVALEAGAGVGNGAKASTSVPLVCSVDGAMVAMVGGEWHPVGTRVKTLVVGTIKTQPGKEGPEPHATDLSYFSRLADADTFGRAATVETVRRGLAEADSVVAVNDGAEWIQGLVDLHCPKAVRILDFPHAAQRLGQIEQAGLVGEKGALVETGWLQRQLHHLRYAGPKAILSELEALNHQHNHPEILQSNLAYLKKREAQMQYPTFSEAGWPIGSGMVESANKLVVEARLKGSGMHWKRANVNSMLALRNGECSGRWDEMWSEVRSHILSQSQQVRAARREAKAVARSQAVKVEVAPVAVEPVKLRPVCEARPERIKVVAQVAGKWRPTAQHPWKQSYKQKHLA